MHEKKFPTSSGFLQLCRFSREVSRIPESPKLVFLTAQVGFFSPTSMIFLAKTCRKRARMHAGESVAYRGLERYGYANNLGFSDALNLEGRPYPKGAFGGENYIPLSAMQKEELEEAAADDFIEIGDAIQKKCEDIALVVSRGRNKELENILACSFREIFRNVFEHSGAKGAVFCVQYWPTRDEVEICIADRGVGIFASLREDRKLGEFTEKEALGLCLMPGVSSKARKHKKKKSSQKTQWDNSGFGLFFTHQIFGELGWFGIASGKDAIFISENQPAQYVKCELEGTLVSLRLDLSDPKKIEDVVSKVQKRAFEVKERIGTKSIDFASVRAFLAKESEF